MASPYSIRPNRFDPTPPSAARRVNELVDAIRQRWRRRALMQGGALTLLVLLVGITLWLLLYTTIPTPPAVRTAVLVLTGGATIGAALWYIARPLMQKISDQQIAMFVEEKLPQLEDRLNSAVEVGDAAHLEVAHDGLLDRLVDDAAQHVRRIAPATVIDRKRERVLVYAAGAFLLLFLVFGFSVKDKLVMTREGGLDFAALEAQRALLTVQPGNVEVERGASQEVIVNLRDEPDQPMVLVYKQGDSEWQKVEMPRGLGEDAAFLHEFLAIQQPIQYYVEYGEERTEPFEIVLYEFPAVAQIDLTYHFPDYTGLLPRTDHDTGDIRGIKGTNVTLDIQATGAIETAELVLDDEHTIPLRDAGEGSWRAGMQLQEPGFYTVRLTDAKGKENKFPVEYMIEPLDDEKPFVVVTDPQRDVRANAVEEVLTAATAADDFGVQSLRLRFSVNGDAEQEIDLLADQDVVTERVTEVEGEHLFYLEDYPLQPGDVISYYVEAADYFHESPEATDMYFIEVIPFDQDYRQQANAGGQQGGQQQSGLVLSQQDIIAATWRLIRTRDDMPEDEYDEARMALVQAQATLKSEIEERINSTAFSLELRGNEEQQKVVENLRQATVEMGKAMAELGDDELRDALTPERKALTFLQRADAQNRENQVASSQGQGGGGAGAEERMTELMDLELDISKDKYETQQQAQRQQAQEVDETMEKLRELARRQENLANQNNPENLEGEERERFIDKLKRDQDELRRQAEQIAQNLQQQSRNQQRQQGQQGSQQQSGQPSSEQLREAQQQMERVADDMRRAEEALRRDDVEEAMQRQQQALNRIEDMQRDLQMATAGGARQQAEDLAQELDDLRQQEQQIARNLEETAREARQSGQIDTEALEQLRQQRERVREDVRDLDEAAEALEARVRDEDPELATAIREARKQMQRDRLEEALAGSEQALEQGWLDRAERLEGAIMNAFDNLDTMRRSLESSAPMGDDERLADALNEVRALQRQLEEAQRGAQQSPQGEQQGQQPGQQQGQPQGEQSGEQQGQQQGEQQGQQGGNAQGRADAARQQRQLNEARQTLERLQRELGGNRALQRPMQELQSGLARADHTGILLDEEGGKEFFDRNIFTALSQLETELARQLDQIELEKKLFGGRRTDVPAEYRTLVEQYYEALSRGN